MIPALLAGGCVGLGLLVAGLVLRPARRSLAATLLQLDAAAQARPVPLAMATPAVGGVRRVLGARLAAVWRDHGWNTARVSADLAVLGRSLEAFLATKVLLGLAGLLGVPLAAVALAAAGSGVSPLVPFWLALAVGAGLFLLPDLVLRSEAAGRRRDFRHTVGSFLDLVSMNLAGGRGVPEALVAASGVGDSWPFRRLREALSTARLSGLTPWAALGALGEELAVDELRDLAASLALVVDDGAKIRASLAARAASLRRKELAEVEGDANERSQSMLVAQMVICGGFLLFLMYPAVVKVFSR